MVFVFVEDMLYKKKIIQKLNERYPSYKQKAKSM